MKKIITLLILFCSVAFAQDVNTTVSQAYKDTLTATVDTVIVRFNAKFDYYTLALQRTSSGTDTVIVQTASFGETYWTTRAIVDLSTGDYITSLYVTATGKEYIIADTDVRAIRLITTDVTAATEFILAGRKGAYIQGNSVVLTTIAGYLDGVEAKLDSIDATASRTEANLITMKNNQTDGDQKTQIVDGSGNVIGATSNALDINVKSGSVAVSGVTSSTNNYAKEHTTVAAADSAVFGFTTKYVTFINDGATTDTLYVSSDPLFPATNTIKRVGSEGFTKPYGVTKLYFKVGATPQASKKIRIEAN